jgi:hypothetical protein
MMTCSRITASALHPREIVDVHDISWDRRHVPVEEQSVRIPAEDE